MTMDMPMMGSDAVGEVGCKAAKEVYNANSVYFL